MSARQHIAEMMAPRGEPAQLVPWPYNDRWGGAGITRSEAQAQAQRAAEMHAAAMRGRLKEFMDQHQAKGASR